MNEEEIITTICEAIQDRLGDANVSRNFLTQTLLPQVNVKSKSEEASKKSGKQIKRHY
jgi:DNA mismatch repair protein MLH1